MATMVTVVTAAFWSHDPLPCGSQKMEFVRHLMRLAYFGLAMRVFEATYLDVDLWGLLGIAVVDAARVEADGVGRCHCFGCGREDYARAGIWSRGLYNGCGLGKIQRPRSVRWNVS